MPIDPSIPLGVKVAQFQSPIEVASQFAQLQGLREQTEARRLAADEARQKRTRQQQIEAAFEAAVKIDPETGEITLDENVLFRGVPGSLHPELRKQLAQDKESVLNLRTATLNLEKAKVQHLGSAAQTVIASGGDPTIWGVELKGAHRMQLIDVETYAQLSARTDPKDILAVAQSYVQRAGIKPPSLEKVTTVDDQGREVTKFVEPTAGASYPAPPKAPAALSYQSKPVLLDGKPALVGFNPQTNTYHKGAEDVTARVQDVPPQSVDPLLHQLRQMQLDAARQAAQSGGNRTPQQVATFQRIVDSYERSPLIRAADRTIVLKDAVKAAKADPTNATNQLNLAYAYIAALDTYQSAVREGELQNLGLLGTRLQQLGVTVDRYVSTGAFIPPAVASQIAASADQLSKTIEAGRTQKQREFGSRAKVSGVGEMWDQFVGGFAPETPQTDPRAPGTTPGTGPKIGERRTIKGQLAEWDGTGWKAVR